MRFPKHTIVGVILELIDYGIIGFIPIFGDIIDIIGTIYFIRFAGLTGLAGMIELFPGADILPTFICLGIVADYFKPKKIGGRI